MIEVALQEPGESGDLSGRQLTYIVIGTADGTNPEHGELSGTDLMLAVIGGETPVAPDSIASGLGDYLYSADASIGEVHYSPGRTIGFVNVDYTTAEEGGPLQGSNPPEGIEATYEFSYQAKSYHVNHALSTRTYSRPDPAPHAPDFGNRINVVKGDGTDLIVNGTDLPGGNTTNIWRMNIPNGFITAEYESYIESIMGSVNSVPFKLRPAHSMRLVQCQSSITMGGQLSISWGFQFEKNREGVTIAGIPGVTIYGHEYWWTFDKKITNITTKEVHLYAAGVYVHQLHEESDWAEIGF